MDNEQVGSESMDTGGCHARPNALLWLRQDLRLHDNPALHLACDYARKHNGRVSAVYIATPRQWQIHDVAPIQLDLIERQLNALAAQLATLGIRLTLLQCDDFAAVPALLTDFCRQQQIAAVFGQLEPEWNECQRDAAVKQMLTPQGMSIHLSQGHCVLAPGTVLNQSGQMYRVFTPFSRAWRRQVQQVMTPHSLGGRLPLLELPAPVAAPLALSSPLQLPGDKGDSSHWAVGESAARQQLECFLMDKLSHYAHNRDFPAYHGTAQISPYLAIGMLSPAQCLAATLAVSPDALIEPSSAGYSWVTELCWREFYRHLLVAFPRLSRGQNFNLKANGIRWRNNVDDFRRWCRAETGYPIVDAAMTQLNRTGWMHNRLRMVVASFLTKHLLIDWRWGEAYFRRQLIDGDLAANNGGWQWAAGTGCDAQPYFRIFNPMSQSEKFDPDGHFIRNYLPQLEQCSNKALHHANVHQSQQADLFSGEIHKALDTDNKETGMSYPRPIVDHQHARQRALTAYSVMKQVKSA